MSVENDYKVISRKVISTYNEGYIGKRVLEVVLGDGTVRRIEQILKNNDDGNAVVIVPMIDDNNFIVIIESRPNIGDGIAYEFPAGMIDSGEEAIVAAKRELLEETGYTSDDIEELEWHYQDQGCSKAKITTYIARNCIKIQEQKLDETEKIKVIKMSYEEILNYIKSGERFHDANSKIAFMSYKLKKDGIL